MTREDVEKWIETEQGKAWLEEKKRPLNEKKEQLLEEVAIYKKRLTDATEKGNALEGKINGYLANLSKAHVAAIMAGEGSINKILPDNELKEFVRSKIEKIADADGGLIPDIDDEGHFKLATNSGKSFADYYNEWTATEGAKSFIANACCGGGARGSNFGGGGMTLQTVKNMTPEQVAARFDDPTFRSQFANASTN